MQKHAKTYLTSWKAYRNIGGKSRKPCPLALLTAALGCCNWPVDWESGFLILAVGAKWKATIVGKVAVVAMIMMIMGVGRHGSCVTWCTADLVVASNGCWLNER
jgi:hypothetical protein